EASRDGQVVSRELVTVTRNGRQVVRLSKESAPLSAAEAWEKSVAALPPEQQVEAVAGRLKELNPGFDGKLTPTLRGPVVTGLAFDTDAVADLSPLRALKWLEALACSGTPSHQGKLADLSPLRGLSLRSLTFGDNLVSDLSPLKGMPLRELQCYRNLLVEDLTPLKGMPLTRLNCGHTRVADLAGLQGMKLTHLSCDSTPLSDLSPLRGMALEGLSVGYCPRVTDLAPLKGMPLQHFWSGGSAVSDLSPLKGMPLKEIFCDFQRERDA